MTREKFPEKIPFRLTRMLVNAMEVSGIEGNFRFTCDSVMRVLRQVCILAHSVPHGTGVHIGSFLQHRDSLMAMLEAFVHDPLINWRLLHPTEQQGESCDNR